MGRLLLNKCLSLLWAMAMATAMIAKCECVLAREATRGSLYWRPSGRLLGRDRTRSMTRTHVSGLWAWYPPSPLALPTIN